MNQAFPLILLTLLTAPFVSIPVAQAQVETPVLMNDRDLDALSLSPFALNRAKNQARQFAERLNGGLEVYRAEASMHGPSTESPYRVTETGQIEFRFLGRSPGASTYTTETVVIIDPETGDLDLGYNGAIRAQGEQDG